MKYSYEEIKTEALKYTKRSEFKKESWQHYKEATLLNILDNVCSHMIIVKKNYNETEIMKVVNKCSSYSEFRKNSTYYRYARKLNLLEKIKKKFKIDYPLKRIKEEALKYKTRKEFMKYSPKICYYAHKNNLLESVCQHMKSKDYREKWDEETLREKSKEFKTIIEFKNKYSAGYHFMRKNNLKDKCCPHFISGKKSPHNIETYRNRKTILYVLKIDNIYKIGITLKSVEERYKYENIGFEIVFSQEFLDGSVAFKIEQEIVTNSNLIKYKGEKIFKYTGITEMFVENPIELINERIKE